MSSRPLARSSALVAAARRNASWWVSDHLQPIVVGDLTWSPSTEMKDHWRDHGWLVLEQAVSHGVIDEVVADVLAYRATHRSETVNPETGEPLRIGLLHAAIRSIREVALNSQVSTFLSWAFQDEPVLFGSLTFEVGSEQEAHVDAAFFFTDPETSMAGVWTAFEDVHEDAGPLFYVDASHTWPRLLPDDAPIDENLRRRVLEYRRTNGPMDLELSDEVYRAYIDELARRVDERQAELTPALLRKGDVFIWHPWLVHGGLPRSHRPLTRRSLVTHHLGMTSRLWDQHTFFLNGEDVSRRQHLDLRIRRSRGRPYVVHPGAVHFARGDGHFEA